MHYYSMSDAGIVLELGNRIRTLRLRKNITQQQLSDSTALSLNVIKSLESGKGKISSLIAVLRELNALDSLDSFLPDIPVSPLQLAKNRGQKRQRASGQPSEKKVWDDSEW